MSHPRSWDIFCRVVDNFGDIGVCWRLARQLAGEPGAAVRLWVDDPGALHALHRQTDPALPRQQVAGIDVRDWEKCNFSAVQPAEVAIEAFGCGLPEGYVQAMAAAARRPLWIVLEYLSAERWVAEHHGLPSPHPNAPVPRYFFFPGFTDGTGGLLREADLAARRTAFDANARRRMWTALGFAEPADGAVVISMFAYERAPLAPLLAAWERGEDALVVAVPHGQLARGVSAHFGAADAEPGRVFRRGRLEVRMLPFVEQPRYDELLWSCDCNFVRGEDSFVRAQWAALPLVWQAYPQADRAHLAKLEAFLDLYCAPLPEPAARAMRAMWRAWNGEGDIEVGAAWRAFHAQWITLREHAATWAAGCARAPDLGARLARFCAERVN